MPSLQGSSFNPIKQWKNSLALGTLCKVICAVGLIFLLFYALWFNKSYNRSSNLFAPFKLNWTTSPSHIVNPPTNRNHVVFGIVGSMKTWKHKKSYIEAWWKPNKTRGYLFLDRIPDPEFLPWPSSFPPFRINEDLTKLKVYPRMRNPVQVRIVHRVLETIRQGDKGVRWYVMADDDTVLILDNLLEVLAKYDHTKYVYIGANSECIQSNYVFSFEMAFGGAAYALSSALAAALEPKLDACIQRYPDLVVSDYMLHQCLADFGVDLTHQAGFHQIDLLGDISGLLSAHSQSPLISLHHLDTIDPIFPFKSRVESVNFLMKAANADHSRILQQTICYHRPNNWSFSISWGYSIHIYESIYPRNYLHRPLETFMPWRRERPPIYMFNTRLPSKHPCEAPHLFFLESLEVNNMTNYIATTYKRPWLRNLPPCSSSGNHSADSITRILVHSPVSAKEVERIECCDVVHIINVNVTKLKLRPCLEDEVLA